MGNTYDIYGRINTTSPTPQFKCSNRITTSKVGLITADEVVYAGGKFGVNNTNYYLYNANIFWTMSPYKSEVGNSYAINVSKNGAIQSACSGNNNGVIDDSGKSGIRPVLNLHKNVNITDLSQNGTIENPYIIEY